MKDSELIKRIQSGEKEFLDTLIERYYDDIYRFCYYKTGNVTLAYDLAQETFLRLVRYIDTYVDKKKFKAYLLTIALNACNDYYRKKTVAYEEIDIAASVEEYDTQMVKFETADYIQQSLNQLSDMQRDAIILKYYYDMKVREIAIMMGTSVPTVKSRLKQGLDKLKRLLREEELF